MKQNASYRPFLQNVFKIQVPTTGYLRFALFAAISAACATVATAQPATSSYAPYSITTYAGAGPLNNGSVDGTGTAAKFFLPFGTAVDAHGNVFVADNRNSTIRKIAPGAVVTTLAGLAGQTGSADGQGSAARFNFPQAVAVDELDNVYVADTVNNTIRKITPAGVVSTIAGTAGVTGSADGTGPAAQFNHPCGVAVDKTFNVYVADTSNSTIRKISPTGVVTTLAGKPGQIGTTDGTGSAARFNIPCGVAVDDADNVYVADSNNNAIRKITPAGDVTLFAGSTTPPSAGGTGGLGSADGTLTDARFKNPFHISIDGSGILYVSDGNFTIRRIIPSVPTKPAGEVTTLAGNPFLSSAGGNSDGVGSLAQFNDPHGIAADATGKIYIGDSINNEIRVGTLVPLPVITSQPQSIAVPLGGTITLSVTATSPVALTYQWLFNGAIIPGATSATFTKQNAQNSDVGSYQVAVTTAGSGNSTNGYNTVMSATASVTIAPPPPPGGHHGGGAPSLWFYAALALIVALRLALSRRSAKAKAN